MLQGLVDKGNTVIVIEHNLDVIKSSDWVVDMGPEGGSGGGLVVAEGTPEQVAEHEGSHTGAFLRPVLAETTRVGGSGTVAARAAVGRVAAATSTTGTTTATTRRTTKAATGGTGVTSKVPAKTASKTTAKTASKTASKTAAKSTAPAKRGAAGRRSA
ncbi:hypothetical protein GCM10025868_02700 [Angustibacter aerolatus]|uniref:UvrABC system protein A n=1 Tax=Angustibacter aerolatus TaxID=1162965 RepID=A0ABQ6J9Z9_9ACTN|nr:hypothetical protein [Angustibacter aerolatus]GMA85020.1 hypothetical protein GCM10025868_02700 [Angustibacter aerolatus]